MLLNAYAKAAENNGLDHYKDMLMEHAAAMDEEHAKVVARNVKKPKAEKKKRKSDANDKADDEDVEMEDVDEEAEVKKSSKKRKKAADSDDEDAEKVRVAYRTCSDR
jgi:hypothetical protein